MGGEGGLGDAGDGGGGGGQLAQDLVALRVGVGVEHDLGGEGVAGEEAGGLGEQAVEAEAEQAGGGEQEGGEGGLEGDEGLAGAQAGAVGGGGGAGGLEAGLGIGAAEAQRRHHAGEHAGQQREQQPEGGHAPVEMDLGEAGQVGGGGGEQGMEAGGGGGYAQPAADQGQGQALEQDLAGEASGGGAEGGADGPIAAAVGEAGEPQPAQVDTNDEQHRQHAGQHQPELLAGGGDGVVAHRGELGEERELVGRGAGEVGLDDVELGQRLRPGDAGAQAADHRKVEVAENVGDPALVALEFEGVEEFGGLARQHGAQFPALEVEAGRQHPHHGGGGAGHADVAADHAGVGVEGGTPELVGDDQGAGGVVLVARRQQAPELRPDAQQIEEVGGDVGTMEQARRAAGGQGEGARAEGGEGAEIRGLAAPGVVGGGVVHVVEAGRKRDLGDALAQQQQLAGIVEGERLQQHAVDHGKHRRGGADAQCQHGHHEGGEAAAAAEFACESHRVEILVWKKKVSAIGSRGGGVEACAGGRRRVGQR